MRFGIESHAKARLIAALAQEKKAEDLVILDLRGVSGVTDFFVIGNGQSARQLRTMADQIMEGLQQAGESVGHLEGYQEGGWILLDCGSAVAHLFSPAMRTFYDLERLWGDAPRLAAP